MSQEWERGGKGGEFGGGISECSTVFYCDPAIMCVGKESMEVPCRGAKSGAVLCSVGHCVQGKGTAASLPGTGQSQEDSRRPVHPASLPGLPTVGDLCSHCVLLEAERAVKLETR